MASAIETIAEEPVEPTPRAPVHLPTYTLGTEGRPNHFTAATARDSAAAEAKSLTVGDAAFIKRSDLKWTYAIVTERVEAGADAKEGDAADGNVILRFEVDAEKNRKSFPQNQWGKYIRVIHADEEEIRKLQEEAGAKVPAEEEEEDDAKPVEEEVVHVLPDADASVSVDASASFGGESTTSKKSTASWFGGSITSLFGTSDKAEKKKDTSVPEAIAEEAAAAEPAPEEAAADAPESSAAGATMDAPAPSAAEELSAASPEPVQVEEASVAAPDPAKDTSAAAPSAEEASPAAPDDTKENSNPVAPEPTESASVAPFEEAIEAVDSSVSSAATKDTLSTLRNPLNSLRQPVLLKKKGSLVNKLFGKKNKAEVAQKKVVISVATPRAAAANAGLLGASSPKNGKDAPDEEKQWFDPEACEVDYDKNPTDLFQALEARQFSYADQMFQQITKQFNKECRTWVVARGQKKKDSHQLRFRALPLHAALVFGAPDDITKKILNAYPKATRGRDVKGRLPIHLAMEHDASEELVGLILEAFPKGFYAKDKKDMAPVDYVDGNMGRSHMKKYIPLVTAAKVEEERVKWEEEMKAKLEAQKAALRTDKVYMDDVIKTITSDVETECAGKVGLMENTYKKEILLLKKLHDEETKALLDGFEVKMNFERKLQRVKKGAQ